MRERKVAYASNAVITWHHTDDIAVTAVDLPLINMSRILSRYSLPCVKSNIRSGSKFKPCHCVRLLVHTAAFIAIVEFIACSRQSCEIIQSKDWYGTPSRCTLSTVFGLYQYAYNNKYIRGGRQWLKCNGTQGIAVPTPPTYAQSVPLP